MANSLFMSPDAAGELLGCTGQTVRQMYYRGEIHAERRGRHFKIPRAEVERLTRRNPEPNEEERERRATLRKARELYAELGTVLAKLEA